MTPQAQIAQQYMAHKGYPNLMPYDVQKIDGDHCWYFLYRLPQGVLELEVSWDGEEWQTLVTTFTLAG